MGAVVGGLYAAGVPVEKLKEELKDLKRGRLMDFYPKALRNMGLMSGDKIVRYLKGLCGDVLIEDLKTPFVATAVDIVTGKPFTSTKVRFLTQSGQAYQYPDCSRR